MPRRFTCLAAFVAACHPPAAVERPPTATAVASTPDEPTAREDFDDGAAFALFAIRHIERLDGRACLDVVACRHRVGAPIAFGETCPSVIELDEKLRTEELASLRRRPGNRCGYELVDPELYFEAAHGRFAVWPTTWGIDRRLKNTTTSLAPATPAVEAAVIAAMTAAIADGQLAVLRDTPNLRDEGTRIAFPEFARRYQLEPGRMLDVVDAIAVNDKIGNGVVRALVIEGPDAPPHVAFDLGTEMIVDEPALIAIGRGLQVLLITTATAKSSCNFEKVLRYDGRVATALATTHVQCH